MKIKSLTVKFKDSNGNFIGTAHGVRAVHERNTNQWAQREFTHPGTVVGHEGSDGKYHVYVYGNGGITKLGKVSPNAVTFL